MSVSRGDIEPHYDLGSYHRAIETPSPQAQLWFDRGVVWASAFNHDEAFRCFERALSLDADLTIARWGIALSVGPNYNKAWGAFDPVDLAASLARARTKLRFATSGRVTPAERGTDRRAGRPIPHRQPQGCAGTGRRAFGVRRRDGDAGARLPR